MRKKKEILDDFPVTTTQSKRDKVELEVLIDIRDLMKTFDDQRGFRIGQASLQEILK